jgi:hypothetical protein
MDCCVAALESNKYYKQRLNLVGTAISIKAGTWNTGTA